MRRPFLRLFRYFPVIALAVFAGSSALGADQERWFQVLISNANSGWMHTVEKSADGKVTSLTEMVLKVKRGPTELGITVRSESVETDAGKPISMKSLQTMGADPVETTFLYNGDKMTIVTEQMGKKTTTERPYPSGEWMPPAAAARYLEEQIKKGEKTVTVRTIDPMSGPEPTTMTHKVIGKQSLTVNGKQVEALKTTSEASIAPGVLTTDYLDENFESIRSETNMGGMSMVMVASGPEVVNIKAGEAPEMMLSTFVKPDKPISKPRGTKRAVYLLSVKEGELTDIPSFGAQKAERIDAKTVRVTVDLGALAKASKEDVENKDFTSPSAALDSTDENIQRLARRATQKAGDSTAAKAEAIRRFVERYITGKGLDVAFATASEVGRNRAGDCTEHGVLLAAMLRAVGIPARVIAGVIYADEFAGSKGIFGYHMWAQALLDDGTGPKWVDLDGTLAPETPFDATHIAMGASPLTDDAGPTAMIAMGSMIGRVQIKVESIE